MFRRLGARAVRPSGRRQALRLFAHWQVNDGRKRANPDTHTKPVVEAIGEDGELTGRVIDLSSQEELTVIKAG